MVAFKKHRNQILKHNGIEPKDVSDPDELCAQLIKDSEALFEYKADKREHRTIPLLTTWLYKFEEATAHRTTNEDKATLSGGGEADKALKILVDKASIGVKVENPEHRKVVQKLQVLRDAQKALGKLSTSAQEVLSTLTYKTRGEKAFAGHMDDLVQNVEKLSKFPHELRDFVVACLSQTENGDADAEQCEKLHTGCEKMVNLSVAYQDGSKIAIKKGRTLLSTFKTA